MFSQKKQMKRMRGHVNIDLWLSFAVMAAGAIFAINGLARDSMLELIAGSVGSLLILLLGVKVVLIRITTAHIQRSIEHFPFGVFLVTGVFMGELLVISGYHFASKAAIYCSPLAGIVGGIIFGALATRFNGRWASIDERLADFSSTLLLLLLPLYIVLAIVPSVLDELFRSGFAEGIKNTFGIVVLLAALTGLILMIHWTIQHYQNFGVVVALGLRFLAFGLFVVAPTLLLSVLFYTGLGGSEDNLNVYLIIEAVILIALFGLHNLRKKSS